MEIEYSKDKDLLRKLNIKVQEVIEEWAEEQLKGSSIRVKHDGALVTVHERPDILHGFTIRVEWPFTYYLEVQEIKHA